MHRNDIANKARVHIFWTGAWDSTSNNENDNQPLVVEVHTQQISRKCTIKRPPLLPFLLQIQNFLGNTLSTLLRSVLPEAHSTLTYRTACTCGGVGPADLHKEDLCTFDLHAASVGKLSHTAQDVIENLHICDVNHDTDDENRREKVPLFSPVSMLATEPTKTSTRSQKP